MKDKRSIKSFKSHKRVTKLTLPSYAWRCSSKLQEIQSWETLFQWPSKVHKYQYTQTHTIFVFFWFFHFLLKKNLKQSKKKKETNKASKLDAYAWRRGERSIHGYNTNVLTRIQNVKHLKAWWPKQPFDHQCEWTQKWEYHLQQTHEWSDVRSQYVWSKNVEQDF